MNRHMFVTLIVIILVIVAFVGFLDFNDHMFQQKTGHITIPPSQGNSKHPLTYLPPTGAIYASGNAIYKYNYTSLKYGAFGPDLWNLEKAQGSTLMNIGENGQLTVNSSFKNVISEVYTILGYPEIGYGYNLEDEMFGNAQSSSLIFPMNYHKFSNLNFSSDSNYTFEKLQPSNIPIDFSYDLWLEQNPTPSNQPTNNDLEVMIWMYSQDNHPIGNQIGQYNITISINGHKMLSTWNVFAGRANPWETVSFVLNTKYSSSSSNITLNLSKFINKAGEDSHLNLSTYTMMGIEIGNEFGNENLANNVSDWSVSYYGFSIGTTDVILIKNR